MRFPLYIVFLLSWPYVAKGLSVDQWVPPFDEQDRLRILCTDNNHFHMTRGRESPLLNNLIRHSILCKRPYTKPFIEHTRKYDGLIWLMQSLNFCDINRFSFGPLSNGIGFTRDFQIDLLRTAFALVCHRTDDIGRFHLTGYADIFRIIYERENEHRSVICNKAMMNFKDLYKRCHVEDSVESSQYSLDFIRNKCTVQRPSFMLKPRTFFNRFSRNCQTFAEFQEAYSKAGLSVGQALANDTVFMNILSIFVKRAISSYSQLPYLVLKTRLFLQHFPMATIKMANKFDRAARCKALDNSSLIDFNENNTVLTDSHNPSTDSCIMDLSVYESLEAGTHDNFRAQGARAWIGLKIEICLLIGVAVNTTILSLLLMQTRNHLSTATILFICNILFSNALFVASFICLFSDLFTDLPLIGTDELYYSDDVPLDVAETLQTQLFAPNEFLKHLAQETLFSLAQNGSLLGLTHLLVLVLVVINRSMAGKAIKLSRRCVISVFACVWAFLVVTHIIFSALQFSAITNLDHLFSRLSPDPISMRCATGSIPSDYTEIGGRCDRVALFHTFGVYLLRGHTLFTLIFLLASIVVFLLTLCYHWRVRSQHDFLQRNFRDQSPHKRRETLFNTLLLSIGAFFVSVSGQSFIEIAVFWADDRAGVAHLATFYQWTRIAAFVDPFFNPILVAVRTPTIRRRLRVHLFVCFHTLLAFFCPCRSLWSAHADVHRKRSTQTADSRQGHFESEVGFLCSKEFVRTSILKRSRSRNSSRNHSVV